MAAINLRERDGLLGRLFDVQCPVMWLHVSLFPLTWYYQTTGKVLIQSSRIKGTDDAVYSVANAEQEIKLFVNSPSAKLVTVKDGQHFLSASHPQDVDNALIEFVGRWHK